MRLSVVVGNPSPNSRTRQIAELLAAQVAASTGAIVDPTVDLCDHADKMFRWSDTDVTEISERVASSDIVIVASPTYKASYTGLLKAFLDRYPAHGLAGVVAIPVMTLGSPSHTLAVDFTLRPLLVELGASVPTRSLAFLTEQLDDAPAILDAWLAENERALGAGRR